MSTPAVRASRPRRFALLQAAHIGPTVAVTVLVALLATASGSTASTAFLVTAAVLTGQLTIGWANDLLDRDRDTRSGRTDKPLANGHLRPGSVRVGLALAGAACVVLSFSVGWRSAVVHLLLVVASGHAYNLGLKATAASWVPYALAFGTLPAVVTLAGTSPGWPAWWLMAAAATLGVAAHFLNTLPDFEDDAATGVRGLPHRLGRTASRTVATTMLVAASASAILGPGSPSTWSWVALAATVVLAAVALIGPGKVPFYAAVGIALIDVALLTVMT